MKRMFARSCYFCFLTMMNSLMIPCLREIHHFDFIMWGCKKKTFFQIWRNNLWFHSMTFNCIVIMFQIMAYFYWIYLQGISVKQRTKLIRFLRSMTLIPIRYSCNRTTILTWMDLIKTLWHDLAKYDLARWNPIKIKLEQFDSPINR